MVSLHSHTWFCIDTDVDLLVLHHRLRCIELLSPGWDAYWISVRKKKVRLPAALFGLLRTAVNIHLYFTTLILPLHSHRSVCNCSGSGKDWRTEHECYQVDLSGLQRKHYSRTHHGMAIGKVNQQLHTENRKRTSEHLWRFLALPTEKYIRL